MGKRFDEAPFGIDHGPFLTGAYAPVFDEKVLEDLEVEGEIPADLNGVYLRNGPDQRFEPKAMHHPFDGDGMLFNAHFNNGKVTIRNKWVRTEGWQKKTKQGTQSTGALCPHSKSHKVSP